MFTNSFLKAFEAESTKKRTENGAITYSTSGNANLDFFSLAAAKRSNINEAVNLFEKAFYEDQMLAIKNLFYVRDIRGGQGERDVFRACMSWLVVNQPEYVMDNIQIIYLIPEYGRWDDFFDLSGTMKEVMKRGTTHDALFSMIIEYAQNQVKEDIENLQAGKPVSLFAKWFPLVNSVKNKVRKASGVFWTNLLFTDARSARKIIGKLRKSINLVETKLSEHNCSDIQYDAIPSKAGMKYRKAFSKNDATRYCEFLEAAKSGKVTINMGTTYPYEIVSKLRNFGHDNALEVMWKNLPDYTRGKNGLVVVDISGSMQQPLPKTVAEAIDVSISMGIYFAQRNKGAFKDYYITFSGSPSLVKVSDTNSLYDNIRIARHTGMGLNTNIKKVFDLILTTAVNQKMQQSDLPETLYLVSDMEFDQATGGGWGYESVTKTLFETFTKRFEDAGYKMPNVVFWNVCSRGSNLPVKADERGFTTVAGLSPSIFKLVTENKTPMEVMVETLSAPRYALLG